MRLVLLLLGSATGLVPLSHLRPVARSRGSALSLHADCGDLVSTLTAAAADAAALKPQINELKDIAAPDLTDALSGFSNDALVYLAAAVVDIRVCCRDEVSTVKHNTDQSTVVLPCA